MMEIFCVYCFVIDFADIVLVHDVKSYNLEKLVNATYLY